MEEIKKESFVNCYPDTKREIWCANFHCKYNDYKGRCTCENVKLSWGHIHTVNDGVIDYYQCKSFEEQQNAKGREFFLHMGRGSAKTIPMSPIPVRDDNQEGEDE